MKAQLPHAVILLTDTPFGPIFSLKRVEDQIERVNYYSANAATDHNGELTS